MTSTSVDVVIRDPVIDDESAEIYYTEKELAKVRGLLTELINAQSSGVVPNGTQPDQRLPVDNTVGGVQFAAFAATTTHIFWTSEDAECRVTFDGSAPTAANGHVIPEGSSETWPVALAEAAWFIRTGAVSAIIHVSQMVR